MLVKIGAWNIRGLSKTKRQDEVKALIREEKFSMCAIVETRLRKIFVKPVGENIFGNWSWVSNIENCRSICTIMVGWDNNNIGSNLISTFDQLLNLRKQLEL